MEAMIEQEGPGSAGVSRSEPGGRAQREAVAQPGTTLQPQPGRRLSQQVDR